MCPEKCDKRRPPLPKTIKNQKLTSESGQVWRRRKIRHTIHTLEKKNCAPPSRLFQIYLQKPPLPPCKRFGVERTFLWFLQTTWSFSLVERGQLLGPSEKGREHPKRLFGGAILGWKRGFFLVGLQFANRRVFFADGIW